jgi:predicted HicB family RNase H-like nuclease
MVNINIEIPEELHKKLKLKALMQDLTLKELLISTLEKDEKKK